ncbi:MAG: hypothetical protein KA902_01880 [Arenimonas sp.]|nr:hypothetical protein [Arenimonas sp.]
MKKLSTVLLLLLINNTSCAMVPQSNPPWINARIAQLQNGAPGNPALSIWQYRYKGQVVYYFPPQCCDIPSNLLDEHQNKICSPDGGMTGNGDGRCTDFYTTRTDEKLLWRDARKR